MNRIILVDGTFVFSLTSLSAEISLDVAEANIGGPGSITGGNDEKPVNLDLVLKRAAEYCQRLERVSLHFVCNEGIKERIYVSWRPPSAFASKPSSLFRENSYVYDYQLIRRDCDIKEQRILIEENGVRRHEENAELKPSASGTSMSFSTPSVFWVSLSSRIMTTPLRKKRN
jgi:hypothetical protein